MTYSNDRLERIEAVMAIVAESNAASTQRLDRIETSLDEVLAGLNAVCGITESNARAIEAWSSRIEEGIAEAEEVSSSMAANTNRRMEEAITDAVQMIASLGQQQQAGNQRAEQHKAESDQRFEVFLAEARADRAEMRAAREQWQLETQANSTEHRAFTQNIQTLLAEIARLWQRVAS